MKQSTVENWIGWGGFGLLTAGLYGVPERYRDYVGVIWPMWIAGCVAYAAASNSSVSRFLLFRNAAFAALVMGLLAAVYHEGTAPTDDYDILPVASDEDSEPPTDTRAQSGLKVFLKVFIGSFIGVAAADAVRRCERRENRP